METINGKIKTIFFPQLWHTKITNVPAITLADKNQKIPPAPNDINGTSCDTNDICNNNSMILLATSLIPSQVIICTTNIRSPAVKTVGKNLSNLFNKYAKATLQETVSFCFQFLIKKNPCRTKKKSTYKYPPPQKKYIQKSPKGCSNALK